MPKLSGTYHAKNYAGIIDMDLVEPLYNGHQLWDHVLLATFATI